MKAGLPSGAIRGKSNMVMPPAVADPEDDDELEEGEEENDPYFSYGNR